MQSIEIAQKVVHYALDKKANDPQILDLRELTTMTDYFVIISANSGRQVEAIADGIQESFEEEHGVKPIAQERDQEARWLLIDYGSVMVHVFREDARSFYDLERLWADATKVEIG